MFIHFDHILWMLGCTLGLETNNHCEWQGKNWLASRFQCNVATKAYLTQKENSNKCHKCIPEEDDLIKLIPFEPEIVYPVVE